MTPKELIYTHCRDLIDQRIKNVQQEISGFQEAANEDTKSSAGDKYETNREMMNLEKDKAGSQLVQLLNMKKVLDTLKMTPQDKVGIGSLVKTNHGNFFIAVGIGKVTLEAKDFMVISGASPIGQFLLGKQVGDQMEFRGVNYEVLGVR